MTRCGFLHLEPGWWSWHWGYHFGGTIFDEASNTFTIDSPENRAAFEWLASATRGRAATVNAFLSGLGPFGTDRMGFLTGEVAMVVQGPWLANQIAAFKPDLDYGVAPLPVSRNAGPEGPAVALIDTDVLMIPSTAKDPEASMAFIAFTQRQENVEHLALAHCKGSPMGKVSDGFFARHTNRGVRLHTELADSPRAFVSPRTSVWMEVKDLLDKMRNDVWNQTTPVEAALASAQETAQAALERVRRRAKLRGEAAYVPQPVAPEPRA
jgi:ABC-type glycerol-3-phosphate transport system substrate-binding protein